MDWWMMARNSSYKTVELLLDGKVTISYLAIEMGSYSPSRVFSCWQPFVNIQHISFLPQQLSSRKSFGSLDCLNEASVGEHQSPAQQTELIMIGCQCT